MRMVVEHLDDYSSAWAAITSVSSKMGMTPETLRVWVRRAQIDGGLRPGLTTDERQRRKELEREVRDLRRADRLRSPCRSSLGGPGACGRVRGGRFVRWHRVVSR